MRRSFLVGLVPVLAFAATIVSTKQAHAGPHLDFDLDLGTAFQDQVDFSYGGGARLGYRINIVNSFVWLQPELGAHYMRFGTNSEDIGYDYAGTLTGGLKLGLRGIIQPHVFGHVGLGALGYNVGRNEVKSFVGPAIDLGAGIDFQIIPGFTLGAQLAYNAVSIFSDDAFAPNRASRWLSFGLTAGFHFGDPPARHRTVYVYR